MERLKDGNNELQKLLIVIHKIMMFIVNVKPNSTNNLKK